MKPFLSTLLLLLSIHAFTQSHEEEVLAFQAEMDSSYADPEHSPLLPGDLEEFDGLPYFPIDSSYRVEAFLEKSDSVETIVMRTTTARAPVYDVYATAVFSIGNDTFRLKLYQSHRLRETEEYGDYLFLPFTDMTNGEESYGGGRYLDLRIPEGDTMVIDFNKAYNPYCAYNHGYSCPIPPDGNHVPVKIPAGVMAPEGH